jgi:hypothetical protein
MDMYINEHIDYDAQLHACGKLVVSEALQLAAGIPSARFSGIELRPVKSIACSPGSQGNEGGR